jgi:serine/threonine-protein kinase
VPFDRPNSVNILMAHVNEPVPALRDMNPNVEVSEALEATIFKCVEKSPDDRFKSMDDVLAALKKAGSGAMTGTMSGADRSGAFDLLSTTGSFTPQPTPSSLGGNSLSGALTPLSPDPGSGANAIATAADLRPKSKVPLVIGGLLAIGAVVGIVVMASSKGDGPSTASSASGTPAATTVATSASAKPTAAETQSASAVPTVAAVEKVKIDSDPSGAMVKDESGTILCDKTPCDVVVDDKPKKLVIDLKDHKNETIAVKKGDPSRQVKLTKSAVWIPPKKDEKKDPGGGGNPNKDFKGDPY